ncbi:DnaA N-terminal domain-containing protein [Albirhodobacter sp. R86504]|uniref:DnaA N-terminal domain-containing protein n=1 Tax=Albirhodobacter sp. R86504 TaxID=3093848 RepID=UPI0036720366
MLVKKPVGRNGAERKYDLLTVLGSYALSQGKTLQRQTLRLICLITARYNWQSDELSVAQTEIARLWSVDTRTVKREMSAFRDRGWLVEKRAAARGRVTLYGLGITRILEDTREAWEKVGPDLVARLVPQPEAPTAPANVIPFPQTSLPSGDTVWGQVAGRLHQNNPAVYQAWFAGLKATEGEGGALTLKAPSGFHARYVETHLRATLERAVAEIAPHIESILIS